MKYRSIRSAAFFWTIVWVAVILVFFLLSIDLLVHAMSHLGKDVVSSFLTATSNPFIGLFIGLVSTAILQSSSTTTSMIVALVASGSLDIYGAIPMVMGANIGTTLTSNIVALSFITKRGEFRRALSAATMHDHFNMLVTAILFPLQYYYNFLGSISVVITRWLSFEKGGEPSGGVSVLTSHSSFVGEQVAGLVGHYGIVLVFSVVLLFVSIKLFSRVIYRLLIGTAKMSFEQFIFSNPYKSFGWGAAITAGIQSSSVTTSLIVPLVATRKVGVNNAFPFILGANVGTTITALLAAVFNNETAVSIALAHLLFNLLGVMIFLPFPFLRNIPVSMGAYLGNLVGRHLMAGIVYIIITFFLIPFAFIYLSR